jgi:hypothetical protein
MAVSTPQQQLVTITIPAEYMDDVRSAVVGEIESTAVWVRGEHKEMVDAIDDGNQKLAELRRQDEAGAIRSLREDVKLLLQLPDADAEVSVSAEWSALFHVLEKMGHQLSTRIAGLYDYGPALVEQVPLLLESLRWSAVQAQEAPLNGTAPRCSGEDPTRCQSAASRGDG